jgi:hypothetical protein
VNYLIVRHRIVENVCVVEESEIDLLAALLGCELVPIDETQAESVIKLGDEILLSPADAGHVQVLPN